MSNKTPLQILSNAIVNTTLHSHVLVDYLDLIEKYAGDKTWAKVTKYHGNRFRDSLMKGIGDQKEFYSEEVVKDLFMHIDVIDDFGKQLSRICNIDSHTELEELTSEIKEIFDKYEARINV